MMKLKYFKNLELKPIGRSYSLLSYCVLEGTIKPRLPTSILWALEKIAELHEQNLVHGDIREGNILYAEEESFLIDFDYTDACGTEYPPGYKGDLFERHGCAKVKERRAFSHDYHALMKLASHYFPSMWDETESDSPSCLCSFCKK